MNGCYPAHKLSQVNENKLVNHCSFLYILYLTQSFGLIIVQYGITKCGMFYLFLILAYQYS